MRNCGLLVVAIVAAVLAPMLLAQQIYTNGPLSTGPTLSGGGGAAPTGATWCEMNTANNVIGFGGSATAGLRNADDFVVPTGEIWTVNSVVVFAYQTGFAGASSPFIGGTLQIWSGNPSAGGTVVAGDTTTNVMTATSDALMYRTTNNVNSTTRHIWQFTLTLGTPAVLSAGTYWVDFQGDTGATHFYPPVTIAGTPSPAGANSQQFNVGTSTWAANVDGSGAQAMPFLLNGSIGGVAPVITSTAPTTAFVGQLYTYTITATGSPTFSVAGNPAWLTLAGNVLSGTPAAGDIGTAGPITITATNGTAPDDTEVFSITVSPSAPEISVDDPSPATITSGTNFPIYGLFTGTATIGGVFTINNLGNVVLNVNAIADANLVNCTVMITPNQTLPYGVPAAGNMNFNLQITATAPGAFSGRVNITSDDADEGTFFFTWSGTMAAAAAPEIAVHDQLDANIANNGTVNLANTGLANFSRTFDIRNEGGATLTLTGAPVVISNLVNCTVTPTQPASSTLAAAFGDPTIETFSLSISPVVAGGFSFTVTIASNDADENPFVFNFNGNTAAFPVSGGGGGGDDDGGCSTGSNGNSWMLLAGLLASLAVALRLRRVRA